MYMTTYIVCIYKVLILNTFDLTLIAIYEGGMKTKNYILQMRKMKHKKLSNFLEGAWITDELKI